MKSILARITLLLICLISSLSVSAVTKDEVAKLKKDYFLYLQSDRDKSINAVGVILESEIPIDRAFAFAAKLYYLTFYGEDVADEDEYIANITALVVNVEKTNVVYKDLTNIYNLLGGVFNLKGQFHKSIENYILAEKYAILSEDMSKQIMIEGNIATMKINVQDYRGAISGLDEVVGNLNFNKTLYSEDKYKDLVSANYLNLGLAYSHLWDIDSMKSDVLRDSAIYYYDLVMKNAISDLHFGKVQHELGTIYNKSAEPEKAEQCFEQSIAHFEKLNSAYDILRVEFNLGVNHFDRQNNDEAKALLLSVLKKQQERELFDDHYSLSLSYLAKIYLREGQIDSVEHYMYLGEMQDDLRSEEEKKEYKKAYSLIVKNDMDEDIRGLEAVISQGVMTRSYIIIGSVVLVLLVLLVLYYQYKKKNEVQQKFDALMVKLSEKKNEVIPPVKAVTIAASNSLSVDQVEKIMKGLKKIEEKQAYLKTTFNNYEAAKYIGTNSKYLTKVLKQNYKTSFTDYLNELRISYIIEQLQEDRKLRNYTIQALAEMIGYKNGVSFSRIFKSKTGITPFQFIQKMADSNTKVA